MTHFHNPYNFVPVGQPDKIGRIDRRNDGTITNPLGQGEPVGHHRYHPGHWSGRIEIKIKVMSPLLIPDASTVETDNANGHKTFDVRTGADGKALLPVTTLKGALRTAYEAVTNSRFGVFGDEHEVPLARRMQTQEALTIVPARVVGKQGRKAVELWLGSHKDLKAFRATMAAKPNGAAREVQAAAWLPIWRGSPPDTFKNAAHGAEVRCYVQRVEHTGYSWTKSKHNRNFDFWEVTTLRDLKSADKLDLAARAKGANTSPTPAAGSVYRPKDHEPHAARGFVCKTNRNFGNKHDERVFFVLENKVPQTISLNEPEWLRLKTRWEQLIAESQALHKDAIAERKKRKHDNKPTCFLGKGPGQPAFSRHTYDESDRTLAAGTPFDQNQDATPEVGTLCYAALRNDNTVEGLFPVMIGRELGRVAPWDLLDKEFRPATALGQLSPPDRVFGWVRQGGAGAYKGQLRIHSITCTAQDNGIERPRNGGALTLPILSAPKPSQARFYLARDLVGTPLERTDKPQSNGYFATMANGEPQTSWRLRGRKVYPHHEDADPIANVPAGLAPTKQNRSIKGRVKKDTVFLAKIDVTNLNPAELGALLWLLELPGAEAYLRLGGGKPLGFGSVRITITGSQLRCGQAMALRYRGLKSAADPSTPAQPKVRQDAIQAFESEIGTIYNGGKFAGTPFIEAFLHAARGFADGHPTHYPSLTEWFVPNNRLAQPLSLGALADGDPALPRTPG